MKIFILILELIFGTTVLAFSLKISAYLSLFLDSTLFGGDLKASVVLAFIVPLILWPVVCMIGLFFIALGMRNLAALKKK